VLSRLVWVLSIPGLGAIAGCTTNPGNPSDRYFVDTLSNGVVEVRYTGEFSADDPLVFSAIETLRLGTVSGGGPDQFGFLSGIAVDQAGFIYVLETLSQEIRVFRPDGSFFSRFGGKGEGPGELSGAYGLLFDPDGRLVVRELRNNRYSVFDRQGRFITSDPIGFFSRLIPWRAAFVSGLGLVDWGLLRPHDPGSAGPSTMTYFPIALGGDLEHQDTLSSFDFELDMITGTPSPRPFGGQMRLALREDGDCWLGNSREYLVSRVNLRGDTILRISMPTTPIEVSAEERDLYVKNWSRQHPIRHEDVMDTKPIIERIVTSENGEVFVFLQTEDYASGSVVDVFSERGLLRGRIELPTRLALQNNLPVIHNGDIYGVTLDGLDVPFVVRLHIENWSRSTRPSH